MGCGGRGRVPLPGLTWMEGAFLLLSLSHSQRTVPHRVPLPSTLFYVTDDVSGMALRSLVRTVGRADRNCLASSVLPSFLSSTFTNCCTTHS